MGIQDTVLTSSPKKRYRRTRSASPMLVDTPIETTIHFVQHALNKRQLQVRGLKTKLGLSSEKVDQLSHSISLKTSESDMVEEKLEGEKRDVDSLRIKFEKEILEKVALKEKVDQLMI